LLLEITAATDSFADAPGLVAAAAAATGSMEEPCYVLVPNAAEGLARKLESAGFTPQAEFTSLARRTAKPLALPKKVAVVAENAIGV
jgi:hypothetical protein